MKSHFEFEEIAKNWSNRLQHKKIDSNAMTTERMLINAVTRHMVVKGKINHKILANKYKNLKLRNSLKAEMNTLVQSSKPYILYNS